jgi:hypothetical protein
MSQVTLPNWEIIDDVDNNRIVIRSKITGQELQLSQSGELTVTSGIDANTLDGKAATDFVEAGETLNAGKLGGKDASNFVETGDTIDADTLNGKDASFFVETGGAIDADTLDGKDSSSFVEASDFPDLQLDGTTIDSSDTINFIPE